MGTLWFAIFLQLFLILGVVHTLATDSLAMNRFQISVFGAVAIVFSVIGVDRTIFTSRPALDAVAAGWLILAIVDDKSASLSLFLLDSDLCVCGDPSVWSCEAAVGHSLS